MADWSKPTTSSNYTDFPNEVQGRDVDAITLLDGRSPTNLPDKAKKFNTSVGRIESWSSSGSTWNAEKLAHNEALTYSGDSGGYHLGSADYTLVSNLSHELDSLTDSEVLQLQNINSVTISNSQWARVGGLSSDPLENNNLATNGGSVPEIDRNNTWGANQNFPTVTVNATDEVDSSGQIKFQRIGDTVTATMLGNWASSSGEQEILGAGTIIPSDMRPSHKIYFPTRIMNIMQITQIFTNGRLCFRFFDFSGTIVTSSTAYCCAFSWLVI